MNKVMWSIALLAAIALVCYVLAALVNESEECQTKACVHEQSHE